MNAPYPRRNPRRNDSAISKLPGARIKRYGTLAYMDAVNPQASARDKITRL